MSFCICERAELLDILLLYKEEMSSFDFEKEVKQIGLHTAECNAHFEIVMLKMQSQHVQSVSLETL